MTKGTVARIGLWVIPLSFIFATSWIVSGSLLPALCATAGIFIVAVMTLALLWCLLNS